MNQSSRSKQVSFEYVFVQKSGKPKTTYPSLIDMNDIMEFEINTSKKYSKMTNLGKKNYESLALLFSRMIYIINNFTFT